MIVRSETVFTLHTAHTSYQLAVAPNGMVLHTYYGSRLPEDVPSLADARMPHSDPGCWPDLLPQELSGSGTADNRTPAVVPEYADGTEAAAFVFDRAEAHVCKPQLPGLPMFRDGNGVETLSVFLKDAGGLSAEVRYTVYETEDLITRTVVYTNTGAEPLPFPSTLRRTRWSLLPSTAHGRQSVPRSVHLCGAASRASAACGASRAMPITPPWPCAMPTPPRPPAKPGALPSSTAATTSLR